MDRTITPQDLKSLIKNKAVTLLDVRRKNDYDADGVVIPGAEWRDPDKVEEWSAGLPQDQEIVIYCARGGSVSNKVLDQLLIKTANARYIEGGIDAWRAANNETRKNTVR